MIQFVELPSYRRTAPNTENGKVATPRRRPNKELRSREHLTPSEVEQLIAAAGAAGRHQANHPCRKSCTCRSAAFRSDCVARSMNRFGIGGDSSSAAFHRSRNAVSCASRSAAACGSPTVGCSSSSRRS